MTWLMILGAMLLTGWLIWLTWQLRAILSSLKCHETWQILHAEKMHLLHDDLTKAVPPLVEMASRTLTLVEQEESRRVEQEAMVGKTWLMSPREQAYQEKQLIAESSSRVKARHYGSHK